MSQSKYQKISLPEETLSNVLNFVNRKSLCVLRGVNHRLNSLISRDFSKTPLLVYKDLLYQDIDFRGLQVLWEKGPMPFEVFEQLAHSKFVRFDRSSIICSSHFSAETILPISHVWENGKLFISWYGDSMPTPELFRAFGQSKEVKVSECDGALAYLQDFVSGNCVSVRIRDLSSAELSSIPWTSIVEFLLRPDMERKELHIVSKKYPPIEECHAFVTSLKERFSTADYQVNFKFSWGVKDWRLYPNFDDETVENKHMQLVINNREGIIWFNAE
ncbi:hypothetical protein Ddc_13998 [Ditylenchus destructor]|nr:hypothetical protein Ddc_13998 [Ditylenchus destructor]